jgi:hypothetical protein
VSATGSTDAAGPRGSKWAVGGLWLGLAIALAALTTQVRDWFAMTNELLYERRAISVSKSLSPLPSVHGVVIHSYDQLYPLLIAPAFARGLVPNDLRVAHGLNAVIISSACIPAYLLARRALVRQWASLVVAGLSVFMPWIFLASFLLTEVAAYPAFLWAILAIERSVAAPSRRTDVLAVLAILLAFTARTQFGLLLAVPPAAILALELRRSGEEGGRARFRGAGGRVVAGHRVLVGVYAVGFVCFLALLALGRLGSVFGVYGQAAGGDLLPHGTAGSLATHVATLSLGLGILPLVVGLAWLSANVVRPAKGRDAHAFACVGLVVFLVAIVEVTIFDLRFGGSGDYVRDRYLLYLLPVVLLGFFCALLDARRPRFSLLAPAGVVALGFAINPPPAFLWQTYDQINSDAPIAFLWRPIVQVAHSVGEARVMLVLLTLVLTSAFAFASRLLTHRALTVVLTALTLVTIPGLTVYMFAKLFGANGWSARPLTQNESGPLTWIDSSLGTGARVSIIPYTVSTDFLTSQGNWRDFEFWNKSVVGNIHYGGPDDYRYTDPTFPKVTPVFNPHTGASDVSPTPYVVQATQESRFHISGSIQIYGPGVYLIRAEEPWRTDWLTFGLTDDGWTKPGVTARVRVFAPPGQQRARIRTVQIALRAPGNVARRPVEIESNSARWQGVAMPGTTRQSVEVCVPAHGFSDVFLAARGSSTIPGDQADQAEAQGSRQGGVFVPEIDLADEVGPRCHP